MALQRLQYNPMDSPTYITVASDKTSQGPNITVYSTFRFSFNIVNKFQHIEFYIPRIVLYMTYIYRDIFTTKSPWYLLLILSGKSHQNCPFTGLYGEVTLTYNMYNKHTMFHLENIHISTVTRHNNNKM